MIRFGHIEFVDPPAVPDFRRRSIGEAFREPADRAAWRLGLTTTFGDMELERQFNPVDVIELVASSHDWSFERSCDDEIAVSVAGLWAEYSVSFSWLESCEALHLGCAFDLKVPAPRQVEVLRLLAKINEQLLVGHFDLWPKENAIMFRHALLLSGGADPTSQQAERMLGIALESCERFYQAFQFVVWANKDADEALACMLFETVGEA